jgi:hypothetical protein
MSEVRGYYLTKVMDMQWAERLLDGELYMRPISDFVDMSRDDPNRGDLFEATLAVTDGPIAWLPEGGPAQYHIYCMYCLEFSSETQKFISPDPQLHEFGNTAVLVVNPIEFFARLRRCFSQRSITLSSCSSKRVSYIMDASVQGVYDEFSKRPSYAWQHEYRLSIDSSMGLDRLAWSGKTVGGVRIGGMTDLAKIMFLNRGGQIDLNSFGIVSESDYVGWEQINDTLELMRFLDHRSQLEEQRCQLAAETAGRKPLILQVGDLRDICCTISTTDLVELKLPFDPHVEKPYILPSLHRQTST